MPTIIRCPSCTRSLTLPDDLVGQLVKCPSCDTQFTAREDMDAPPPLPTYRPQPAEPRAEIPPPLGRRSWDDDEEKYYGRARQGSRTRASAEVSGPATALQVIGWLYIVGGILLILCGCFGVASMDEMGGGRNRHRDVEATMNIVVFIFSAIMSFVVGILILIGASRMKNLESYGWALAASILSILSCGILGLAFGIWAIVVINKPEVRSAFPGQGS